MKRNLFTLLLTLFLVQSGFSQELKVMSYNLRFGELSSTTLFSEFINEEAPDIVALQECDWATYRDRSLPQNGVRFVNELAFRTGMFGIYGKAIDYAKGYYGVGILSKYPIIKSERIFLPCDGKTEQRVMLLSQIELPKGKVITFVCAHLEVSSAKMRSEQIAFIKDYLSEIEGAVILAGDFNARPYEDIIKKDLAQWQDLTNAYPTFYKCADPIKIDYMYASPSTKLKVKKRKVYSNVELSDHYPLMTTIVLK